MPEKVFGVFRNSFTKTATITAASFVRGNPVLIASASNNGYDVVHADTAGQPVNDLFCGVVADYPDTTSRQNRRVAAGGLRHRPDLRRGTGRGGERDGDAGCAAAAGAEHRLPADDGRAADHSDRAGSSDTGAARTGIAGLAVLLADDGVVQRRRNGVGHGLAPHDVKVVPEGVPSVMITLGLPPGAVGG
jgi:hypothetical protein